MAKQRQFDKFTAAELHCPRCRQLQPVRERLLLILPQGEIYEYRCVRCGESLGSRQVSAQKQGTVIPAGHA